MTTYLLVNASNVIDNIVEWDGTTPYPLSEGDTAVAYSGPAAIGWTWDGTTATNPNPAPTASPPSLPPMAPSGLVDAADDGAAANANVPVSGMYRNGSQLMIRVS